MKKGYCALCGQDGRSLSFQTTPGIGVCIECAHDFDSASRLVAEDVADEPEIVRAVDSCLRQCYSF